MAVDPGDERGGAGEHGEDRTDPQQQVPAGGEQWPHAAQSGADRAGARRRRRITTRNASPGSSLRDHGRPRRAGDTEVESVHEHERAARLTSVRGQQDHQRRPVVGRAPLHALGTQGEQHERDAEHRDAQVLDREVVDVTVGTEQRRQGRQRRRTAAGTAIRPTMTDNHIAWTPTSAASSARPAPSRWATRSVVP